MHHLPQRYKRLLQAMIFAVAIIYTTLVLYQSTYGYPDIQLATPQHSQLDRNVIHSETQPNGEIDSAATRQLTLHNTLLKLLQYQTIPTQNQLKLSPSSASSPEPAPQQPQPPLQQKTNDTTRRDMGGGLNLSFFDIGASKLPTAALLKDRSRRNGELLQDQSQRAVTATPKPPITELDDIFISVKTTKDYHETRLKLIVNTWFQLARDQTWFFSDTDDSMWQEKTKGHLINTNCSEGHTREALSCKMSAELDEFMDSGKNWFCHFDDDNYVNVPRLVELLDGYNPSLNWYLGKPSIPHPIVTNIGGKMINFWFGTGGAGFCLSRSLTQRMLPIAGGSKFIRISDEIRFPDDVTMGFIIEHLLKVNLTVVEEFHSHYEPMEDLNPKSFQKQVSFSYVHNFNHHNVVRAGGLGLKSDPNRFYSLHCQLFPYFSFCPPR